MFGIGMGELILILIVALLVVGPRDLPKVARWLGRTVKSARHAAKTLSEALELDDLKEDIDGIKGDIDGIKNDVNEARKIEKKIEEEIEP
jgi:sec-independent protein translocase protein TatB